jgi:flagellar assembly factor FliW
MMAPQPFIREISEATRQAFGRRKGMLIHTKDYDFVEVREEDILHFPDGVYAFEDSKRFVVLDTNSSAGIMQLQCSDAQTPRFIILDPFLFVEDYTPKVPEEVLAKVKAKSQQDLTFFVIAVIPDNVGETTVNLKSPVVINFTERLGMKPCWTIRNIPSAFACSARKGRDKRMLVITRQPGSSILIGEDIKVTILEVSGDKIKIGIDAPKSVRIMRSEVLDTVKANLEADQSVKAQVLESLKDNLKNKLSPK